MSMGCDEKPIEINNSALAIAEAKNVMGMLGIYNPNKAFFIQIC